MEGAVAVTRPEPRGVKLLSCLLLTGLAVAACAGTTRHSSAPAQGAPAGPVAQLQPASVQEAIRVSHDLGPVAPSLTLHLTLGLQRRNSDEFERLLAENISIPPRLWLSRFAPDPVAVQRAASVLRLAGLTTSWSAGDMLVQVSGSAVDVDHFFHTSIHSFRRSDGVLFHAPLTQPAVPQSLGPVVNAATGFDDYPANIVHTLRDPAGLSPDDVIKFYDVTPLRSAGLDGSGMTVMFPEWAAPSQGSQASLSKYASDFGLSPFSVQVRTDPSWGPPLDQSSNQYLDVLGEEQLDLEIVHAIAPAAKLIVYALGTPGELPAVFQAMAKEHPGQIISSSLGNTACEPVLTDGHATGLATADDDAATAAAQSNTTFYDASGDTGAYGCQGADSHQGDPAVDPLAASPHLTSVGGTAMLLSSTGAYFREVAWGEPISAAGGGGGISTIFPRPAWQNAPGVPANLGGRGVPDISANADVLQSPWHIIEPDADNPNGGDHRVGGTSAAAPFWAAITALIDQDLQRKGLSLVGFANPALYTFAQSPSGLPAPAFHDVMLGTNLHYAATAGWDAATGLGTPEVAALADDFEWYERSHHSS